MVRLRSWKEFDLAPVNGDRETRQGCGQWVRSWGTLSALLGVWALPEGNEAPRRAFTGYGRQGGWTRRLRQSLEQEAIR